MIADDDCARIKNLRHLGLRGRVAEDDRCFITPILWVGRIGVPCRDLPECLGRWVPAYHHG